MRSAADWVPDGAWLAPGYAEWAPPPPLRGLVACFWVSVVPDRSSPPAAGRGGLVLPDGCSDLIWQQGAGAFVAGPDTGPVHFATPPGAVLVGVRFRSAAGGGALGMPLSEIRDMRVGLAEVLPAAARLLPASLDPAIAAQRAREVAGLLLSRATPDCAVGRATTLLRDPAARVEQVAEDVDLSMRQLRRRFHDAVGYGPKTLQRVLRFQRFVRALDAGGGACDLAASAADAGYADQPHLTRECVALSGMTPAALARIRGGSGVGGIGDHGGGDLAEA